MNAVSVDIVSRAWTHIRAQICRHFLQPDVGHFTSFTQNGPFTGHAEGSACENSCIMFSVALESPNVLGWDLETYPRNLP